MPLDECRKRSFIGGADKPRQQFPVTQASAGLNRRQLANPLKYTVEHVLGHEAIARAELASPPLKYTGRGGDHRRAKKRGGSEKCAENEMWARLTSSPSPGP